MQISTADWYPRFHEAQLHCAGNAPVAEVVAVLDALRTAVAAWALDGSEGNVATLRDALIDAGGATEELGL